jgi:hypothetical protein
MNDVAAQNEHWREFGPPVHIGLAQFAAGWGMAMTKGVPVAEAVEQDPAALMAMLGDLPERRYVAPQLGLPAGDQSKI